MLKNGPGTHYTGTNLVAVFNQLLQKMEFKGGIKLFLQLIGALMILIISGCEKLDTGKPFDVKVGTKYRVENGLSFTIDSVRDYRCPTDLICIWGGDVDLYFHINHNLRHTDTLISMNNRDRNPFRIMGFTWKVLDVNPRKKSDESIPQEDYEIKMILMND